MANDRFSQIRTERFEILSEEGLPIRGILELPDMPWAAVVMLHGFKGYKDWNFFPFVSEELAKDGVAVCRFDMSRCGISEGSELFDRLELFADDTYSIQLSDLSRVLDHLDTLDAIRTIPRFLLGHSRGGAVAILGAADSRRIRGVITWSSISHVDRWDDATKSEWRQKGFLTFVHQRTGQEMKVSRAILDDVEQNKDSLNLAARLESLEPAMLVIHGSSDETVPVEEAREIATKARNSALVIIDEASHTYNSIHPMVHVPRPLRAALAVTSRFISAYTQSIRAPEREGESIRVTR